jgi:hypothetical protein
MKVVIAFLLRYNIKPFRLYYKYSFYFVGNLGEENVLAL